MAKQKAEARGVWSITGWYRAGRKRTSRKRATVHPASASFVRTAAVLAVVGLEPSAGSQHNATRIGIGEANTNRRSLLCPSAKPVLFAIGGDIVCEPHLPGFKAPVAEVFGN